MSDQKKLCPHCGMPLSVWEPHPEGGWDHDLLLCENNECSYFVRGRSRICREYEQNFSYRFCCDPKTGKEWPAVVRRRFVPSQRSLPLNSTGGYSLERRCGITCRSPGLCRNAGPVCRGYL